MEAAKQQIIELQARQAELEQSIPNMETELQKAQDAFKKLESVFIEPAKKLEHSKAVGILDALIGQVPVQWQSNSELEAALLRVRTIVDEIRVVLLVENHSIPFVENIDVAMVDVESLSDD